MQRPGTCGAAATDTGNLTKELLCLLRVWGPDIIYAERGQDRPCSSRTLGRRPLSGAAPRMNLLPKTLHSHYNLKVTCGHSLHCILPPSLWFHLLWVVLVGAGPFRSTFHKDSGAWPPRGPLITLSLNNGLTWILTFRSTSSQCRPERLGGAPTKHSKQNMSPSQGGVIALISASVVMVPGENPRRQVLACRGRRACHLPVRWV